MLFKYMKKKGEEFSLWFLLELIGAIFVGYLAVDVAVSYTQGTIYEKLNIAKDLAMQINTLQAVPGDAYVLNDKLHGYSVYFIDNKIEVYEEGYDQSKGVYYFVNHADSKIDIRLIKPKQVVIAKINNQIKISEDIPI
jgi:hypothetical protein